MKKTLLICMLFLLLALACFLPVGAAEATAPTEIVVFDLLDALTPEEEESLSPDPTIDAHGVEFYLITMQTAFSDDRIDEWDLYDMCGFESYDPPNAVILVVRKAGTGEEFYYDMYTYGDAYDIFSDRIVDRVLDADAVYGNLKAGKIKDGATAFFHLCATEVNEHYEDLAAKERRAPLVVVLIAVVTGVIAAGISILAVVLSYRKKQHGETYPLDRYARLNLTHREDRFVGSFVTRVRVQSSSGGSHGGSRDGGGGRGGGGFRGGR